MPNSSRSRTEVLPKHAPFIPRQLKVRFKTWSRSIKVQGWKTHKLDNSNLEHAYHRLITEVKSRHLKTNEVYFERDYKNDADEGYLAMHTFLTSSFYIYLECDLTLAYHVEFAFHNCPYEAAVRKLLHCYPTDTLSREIELQPDLPTFYKRTLACQPVQFIHALEG